MGDLRTWCRFALPMNRNDTITRQGIQVDIYVGNLPYKTDGSELEQLFSEYGAVERVHMIADRQTGRPKGFGFVTMNDATEANNAIEALNGKELEGRPMKVNEAQPREDRPRSGGGGGGGGGGGFRSRDGGGNGGGGGFRPRSDRRY
jgi:RNA recognition motif-containing protein